ncbi:MAG: hypothetical protein IPJ04_02975 [Candidatus Eisenbacteria bacterium]|jgi:hypothetical protein|nr:hypothetical protein [Candidatus Eisenbacteria bacterium]
MTRSGPRDRHLDFATTLDYLDQRLDTSRGREVEEHLGRPCPVCREKLRTLGGLLETMRRDRTGEVPAHLHRIALDVFTPREQVSPVRRALETLAELVFDSLTSPLPAAVRRSVGEARRLRFKLGGHVLELEIEREGAATVSLRGVLAAADPALWTIEVLVGGERRTARPDANGEFALEDVPAGELEMVVNGPAGRFRLPAIEG